MLITTKCGIVSAPDKPAIAGYMPVVESDFSGGSHVDERTIIQWEHELVKLLSESDQRFSCMGSGNSFVFAYKHGSDEIMVNRVDNGYFQTVYKKVI